MQRHRGEVLYETPTPSPDTLWGRRSLSFNSTSQYPARSPPGIMQRSSSASVACQHDYTGPSLPDTPVGLCFPRVTPCPPSIPEAPDLRRRISHARQSPLPVQSSGPPTRDLPPLPSGGTDDRRRRRIGRQFDPLDVVQAHHTQYQDQDHGPPTTEEEESSSSSYEDDIDGHAAFGMIIPSSRHSSSSSSFSSFAPSPSSPLCGQFPQPPPLKSPLLRRMQSSPTIRKRVVSSSAAHPMQVVDLRRSASARQRTRTAPLVRINEIDSPPSEPQEVYINQGTGEDFSWEAASPSISLDVGAGGEEGKFGFQQWLAGGEDPFHNAGMHGHGSGVESEVSSSPTVPSEYGYGSTPPPRVVVDSQSHLKFDTVEPEFNVEPEEQQETEKQQQQSQRKANRSSALNRLELSLEKLKVFNSSLTQLGSTSSSSTAGRGHMRSFSTGSGLGGKFSQPMTGPSPTAMAGLAVPPRTASNADNHRAFSSSINGAFPPVMDRSRHQHRAHQSEAMTTTSLSMPGAFAADSAHPIRPSHPIRGASQPPLSRSGLSHPAPHPASSFARATPPFSLSHPSQPTYSQPRSQPIYSQPTPSQAQPLGPAFTQRPSHHRPTKSHAALSDFQYPTKKLQKDRRMTSHGQPAGSMHTEAHGEEMGHGQVKHERQPGQEVMRSAELRDPGQAGPGQEGNMKRDLSFKRVKRMISRASISLQGWRRELGRSKKGGEGEA